MLSFRDSVPALLRAISGLACSLKKDEYSSLTNLRTMKQFIATLAFSITAVSLTVAQSPVRATDIIAQINRGESVEYTNVEIEGVLDLTDLDNRHRTESSGSWFGLGNRNDTYESDVEVSLSFTDCTFLDDVLAYYHNEDEDDTFIANFEEDVVFSGCTFRRASEFKYSDFSEEANFEGVVFEQPANFKYAEFSEAPVFSKVVFQQEANFKYAEFPKNTAFAHVVFEREANFKYADFPAGSTFESTVFNDLANFKYSEFETPLNLDNVAFNGSEDFKYTEVDGEEFTSFLLKNQ